MNDDSEPRNSDLAVLLVLAAFVVWAILEAACRWYVNG